MKKEQQQIKKWSPVIELERFQEDVEQNVKNIKIQLDKEGT